MEPENKKERKAPFTRFLVLFILGIIIVLVPFYFTMSIPGRESKDSNEKLQRMEESIHFQRDIFSVHMDSAQHMFDGFEDTAEDIDKLNADIGALLSKMEQYIANDTSWRAAMNKNIIATYLSLKKLNNALITKDKEIADLNHQLILSKRQQKKAAAAKKSEDSLD